MLTQIETRIPALCTVRRRLPEGVPVDVDATLNQQWTAQNLAEQVRGKRIAIGIGSRGVAAIPAIARRLVALVKQSGGEPFIVPAMGSHGGATPAGQIEVLAGLGVTEASVGCPLRATMETVILGETADGFPLHFDRNVAEADGFILANRVKIHTDFHGPHESGVLKMLAIGLGKENGAARIHSFGVHGLRSIMPEVAKGLLERVNLIAGVATVEDGYHRPVRLEVLRPQELVAGEQRLLDEARRLMPRLPVDDIDVLVVDLMGKDISGAGMDTNIIGRWRIAGEPEPEAPRVKALVVLDLTEASHGNATGVGLADFTTRRLLDKIDFPIFTKNVFTSGFPLRGYIPLVYETDEAAIDAALTSVFRPNPPGRAGARVVRIGSTLDLEEVQVSPNLLDEVRAEPGFINASESEPLHFMDGALF
ncbi:MAG: DUF362 domain-containing protein [Anaerolineae bacterium]|nr:DUF362 domain-containing protein [Anaerolineae bacterium]